MLSKLFLFISYKSNNPLSSCMYLIVSLVAMGPVIVLSVKSWMVFIFYMVFITGILMMMLYFTSMGVYYYFNLNSYWVLFILMLVFYPYAVHSLGMNNYAMLFNLSFVPLMVLVLVFLLALMLFCSYMLNQSGALRKL